MLLDILSSAIGPEYETFLERSHVCTEIGFYISSKVTQVPVDLYQLFSRNYIFLVVHLESIREYERVRIKMGYYRSCLTKKINAKVNH